MRRVPAGYSEVGGLRWVSASVKAAERAPASRGGHVRPGRVAPEAVPKQPSVFHEFLYLCERFDQEVLPDGPGSKQRAGLIAVAVPGEQGR